MLKKLDEQTRNLQGDKSGRKYSKELLIKYEPPECPFPEGSKKAQKWNEITPILIKTRKLSLYNADLIKNYIDYHFEIEELEEIKQKAWASMGEGRESLFQESYYSDSSGKEYKSIKQSAILKTYFEVDDHIERKRDYILKLQKMFELSPDDMKGVYRFTDEEIKDEGRGMTLT